MYSINGVPLDNPALGWELLAPTVPLSALQMSDASTVLPGQDGVTPSPATRGPVTLKFVVRSPAVNRGTLLSFFSQQELTIREMANPSRFAVGRMISSSPEQHFPKANLYSDAFLVRIHSGSWRDAEITTSLLEPTTGGAVLSLFTDLGAPVQDALLRFKGPMVDPQVVDSSGAFFTFDGEIGGAEWLWFDSKTRRARITTANAWDGGDEVTGIVDFGGPRGRFEITPRFKTPADPREREGRLVFSAQSHSSGAGLQVRGRPAFLL